LFYNDTGSENTAAGYQSLANGNGSGSSAFGFETLENATGSKNIAVGFQAGRGVGTGSNNIDIGNVGASGDSDTVRIGIVGTQKETFIAGISTSKVTGAPVYVTAAGQLGVLASSERYKTDIESLVDVAGKLRELRPVSFHLKSEPQGAVQYGLIAEEVNKVYPELVIRDEDGTIQGVRYDELAPMLLQEMQQQQWTIHDQAGELAAVKAAAHAATRRMQAMQQELDEVVQINRAMQAEFAQMKARDERVAMR
jgi:hypothetical protein